ncbi:acyl-CoA N-acyltransferase [Aspergillus unguis]
MSASRPDPVPLEGRTVDLVPLTVQHADDLFPYIDANTPEGLQLWKYIPDGPYYEIEKLRESFVAKLASPDVFFAIIDKRDGVPTAGKPVGYLSLMSIVPEHRRLEIGHVVFMPPLQRTTGATEALYFALGYAFYLGYMRVEWKCDQSNEPSRRAALRLGYRFEGIFRQHMWVRGVRRDTAWYSILREEWLGEDGKENGLIHAMEKWLDESNFEGERQVKTLESLRA